MELKIYLKQLIDSKGISVSRLAKATGVPNTTIANWLAGQAPKNIEQVKKVADYFGISIDELVFGNKSIEKFKSILREFTEDEIYAGQYEVVLKRIITNKERV